MPGSTPFPIFVYGEEQALALVKASTDKEAACTSIDVTNVFSTLFEANWLLEKCASQNNAAALAEIVENAYPVDVSDDAPPIPILLPPKSDKRAGDRVYAALFEKKRGTSDADFCEVFKIRLTEDGLNDYLEYSPGTRHARPMLDVFCDYNPIVRILREWVEDGEAPAIPDRLILSIAKRTLPVDLDYPALGDFCLRNALAERRQANQTHDWMARVAKLHDSVAMLLDSYEAEGDEVWSPEGVIKDVLRGFNALTLEEQKAFRRKSYEVSGFGRVDGGSVADLLTLISQIADKRTGSDDAYQLFLSLADDYPDRRREDMMFALRWGFDLWAGGDKRAIEKLCRMARSIAGGRRNAKRRHSAELLPAPITKGETLKIGRYRDIKGKTNDRSIANLFDGWASDRIIRITLGGEDDYEIAAPERFPVLVPVPLKYRIVDSRGDEAGQVFRGRYASELSRIETKRPTFLTDLLPRNADIPTADRALLENLDGYDFDEFMIRFTKEETRKDPKSGKRKRGVYDSDMWVAALIDAGVRGMYAIGARIILGDSRDGKAREYTTDIDRYILRLRGTEGVHLRSGASLRVLSDDSFSRMKAIVNELRDGCQLVLGPVSDIPLNVTINFVEGSDLGEFDNCSRAMNWRAGELGDVAKLDREQLVYSDRMVVGRNEFARFLRENSEMIANVTASYARSRNGGPDAGDGYEYIWHDADQLGLGWTQVRILEAYAKAEENGKLNCCRRLSVKRSVSATVATDLGEEGRNVEYSY